MRQDAHTPKLPFQYPNRFLEIAYSLVMLLDGTDRSSATNPMGQCEGAISRAKQYRNRKGHWPWARAKNSERSG